MNHARNWIGASVTKMNSSVAKANSGDARGQVHRTTRLNILLVVDGAVKVLLAHAQRVQRPNVRDWVRALVSGTDVRAGTGRSAAIGDGGVTLQCMTQNVKPGECRHLTRHVL